WCTRALLPGLRTAARPGRGRPPQAHVVNVVSIAGAIAFARSGPYVASKHAQLAFSRCLRPTLARSGVAVHTIMPGFVETEGFPQSVLRSRRRSGWLVTEPAKVAEAIVHAVDERRPEVTVPWFPYRFAVALHGIAPGLIRKVE